MRFLFIKHAFEDLFGIDPTRVPNLPGAFSDGWESYIRRTSLNCLGWAGFYICIYSYHWIQTNRPKKGYGNSEKKRVPSRQMQVLNDTMMPPNLSNPILSLENTWLETFSLRTLPWLEYSGAQGTWLILSGLCFIFIYVLLYNYKYGWVMPILVGWNPISQLTLHNPSHPSSE